MDSCDCRIDGQYMQDEGYIHFTQTPSSSVCPPQPHTPKSCFCTVWRKPTTSSRCSSLTQGCRHCPTAQRSKFRCVSARRTRCIAARPTPTVPAFSCCLRHSCSPYSVSTIKTRNWGDVLINVSALMLQRCVLCISRYYVFLSTMLQALPRKSNLNLLWISHLSH